MITTHDYADETVPTIVYLFAPECSWCSRNLANIKAVSDQVQDRYALVGLSLTSEGLPEYVSAHQFDFPVLTNVAPDTLQRMSGGTPITYVVDTTGTVLKVWRGAYMDFLLGACRELAPSKQESTTYEPSLVCKLLILGCRLLIPDRLLEEVEQYLAITLPGLEGPVPANVGGRSSWSGEGAVHDVVMPSPGLAAFGAEL